MSIKLSRIEWEQIGKTAGWIKKATQWAASDTKDAKYLGPLEFQSNDKEWHNFEVQELSDRIIFGGATNTGFMESGYIMRHDGETSQDLLQELIEDLKVFYNDGPRYVSRIVVNERM